MTICGAYGSLWMNGHNSHTSTSSKPLLQLAAQRVYAWFLGCKMHAAQVSEKYGQDALKTLMASVGTTIIVQVNHGETALTLERYFGKTSYLEWKRKPLGTLGGLQWVDNRVEEAPFRSTEFSTLLGTDKHGVRCLVSGVGKHLYKVVVPLESSFTDEVREPARPAAWTTTFKVDGKFATDDEIAAYMAGVKSRKKADLKTGD